MEPGIVVALITSFATLVGVVLVGINARRANRNSAEADLRRWVMDLQKTLRETQQGFDALRVEAHALTDELRAVRAEAWRAPDLPTYREWLASRPAPGRRAT